MKNPGCVNNRGSPLYASGNSSYQILRFPNAPAAMMLIHFPPGICSYFYVFKCVRTNMVAVTGFSPLLRVADLNLIRLTGYVFANRSSRPIPVPSNWTLFSWTEIRNY